MLIEEQRTNLKRPLICKMKAVIQSGRCGASKSCRVELLRFRGLCFGSKGY